MTSIIFPTGMILLWYGSIATIPSGYQLCDGTNGTPNLLNRMIICADVDNTGVASTTITGAPTQTGGTKDAVVVAHTHTLATAAGFGAGSSLGNYVLNPGDPGPNTIGPLNFTTASTGVSGTNQNLPPYYSLAYIMKL